MKQGDKVKILPYEMIRYRKETSHERWNIDSFYSDGLLFDPAMKQYCGKQYYTISGMKEKPYGMIYRVEENPWWWHHNWLTLISGDFLSDKDFEI